jgi:hypothetical protein
MALLKEEEAFLRLLNHTALNFARARVFRMVVLQLVHTAWSKSNRNFADANSLKIELDSLGIVHIEADVNDPDREKIVKFQMLVFEPSLACGVRGPKIMAKCSCLTMARMQTPCHHAFAVAREVAGSLNVDDIILFLHSRVQELMIGRNEEGRTFSLHEVVSVLFLGIVGIRWEEMHSPGMSCHSRPQSSSDIRNFSIEQGPQSLIFRQISMIRQTKCLVIVRPNLPLSQLAFRTA